jgi:hypothetical protein
MGSDPGEATKIVSKALPILPADGKRAPLPKDETRSDLLFQLVGDTGIEPVTSSVSRKRAPAAPIALDLDCRGGDGI